MNKRGFTLIEILVVVGIVALVGTLAAIAVNAARSKQRDATRLSQVRLVQSALEDYFNETNAYPTGEVLPLGDARQSACLGSGGFAGNCTGDQAIFLRVVSATIDKGLHGQALCGDPARNAFCYTQTLEGTGYKIEFELENALVQARLVKGINCATPDGISGGECE
jgi:general secretion pathway protein G